MKRNRDFNQKEEVENAVRLYERNPSIETFMSVADLVTPEMNRGGVNRDGYTRVDRTEIIDIALVYRGFKPVAFLINGHLPTFLEELEIKLIEFEKPVSEHHMKKYRFVWKLEEFKEHTIAFVEYMRNYKGDYGIEHARNVGRGLGYPEDDIDAFVESVEKKMMLKRKFLSEKLRVESNK